MMPSYNTSLQELKDLLKMVIKNQEKLDNEITDLKNNVLPNLESFYSGNVPLGNMDFKLDEILSKLKELKK